MHRRSLPGLRAVIGFTLALLLGCGGDNLAGVKPKLAIHQGTPTDSSGHYVLDFGDVALGAVGHRSLVADNIGRAKLTLQPLQVSAPFGSDLAASAIVPVAGYQSIDFTFTPTAEGPATATVQLNSDGGQATIVLQGNGVNTAPTCAFDLQPMTVDFGNVAKGLSKTSGFRLVNKGSGDHSDCVLTSLSLSSDSDAAFSLASPPMTPQTLSAGTGLPIAVTFAPTHTSRSFVGKVVLQVGPAGTDSAGMMAEVPLQASSVESCPSPLPDGSCPAAAAPIYLNTPTSLYSFDTTSHTSKYVGNFKAPGVLLFQMFDIGIDTNGILVGMSDTSLYTINPTTAACSLLADVGMSASGLTFLPDGNIVIAGDSVVVFDRSTHQLTTLVPSGKYSTSGDIVGLPDGLLYWAVHGSGSTDLIVTIDPKTGATNEIGDTGFGSIWGLSYADNVFYGFTAGGQYLTIDAQTAHATAHGLAGNWYGAATNPTKW